MASSIRRWLCVCSLNLFTNIETIVRTLVVASAPILLASFSFSSSAASMVVVTMQSLFCQILERSTLFSNIQRVIDVERRAHMALAAAKARVALSLKLA
ncbi:hypothetical protein EVAR_66659_1 [Eumeta japonica]|uniref:Uncharacterized protein n=1 Tax=Eumeta variegata TaxID=151549 RepID=A0A4C1ZCW9_EUMVA|nr:hypothetical protein EVAR_66659_1 [Eumeta japonica]